MANKRRMLIPHIRNFINQADKAQLRQMEKQLSKELEQGLLKDRPEHSYTLELELIKRNLKKKR